MRQILWCLFKKIVIADNCAQFANEIFNNSAAYNGSTLVLGVLFFTFQIYCDFSGYSDIAIGSSTRLFGFDLMQNLIFLTFLETSQNSGGVGIYHFLLGLETIYIFLWVEAVVEPG
jgi:D-alanyl-lipoteichoic acid acyltransferase DltB (MBOAT superfamily)